MELLLRAFEGLLNDLVQTGFIESAVDVLEDHLVEVLLGEGLAMLLPGLVQTLIFLHGLDNFPQLSEEFGFMSRPCPWIFRHLLGSQGLAVGGVVVLVDDEGLDHLLVVFQAGVVHPHNLAELELQVRDLV